MRRKGVVALPLDTIGILAMCPCSRVQLLYRRGGEGRGGEGHILKKRYDAHDTVVLSATHPVHV